MRIAIIHTEDSPCRCAEHIASGLRTLGHEPLIFSADDIESSAVEIAHTCDLVIDHTDTFRGRGISRPYVRLVLEAHGARLVGCDSAAGILCDNKVLVKERLSRAGIPVPPGIAVTSRDIMIPEWLKPPYIVKPACEHMSRGLTQVMDENSARDAAVRLLNELSQPAMIETWIPGRELAVSLIDDGGECMVLPPLEWLPGTEGSVLTESFKLREPVQERNDAAIANLPSALLDEITGLARTAFRTLNMRDYGRFDVRLSPGGTFYFLEANVTPSMEPFEAMPLSARHSGLDYPALLARLLSVAQRRYEKNPAGRYQAVTMQFRSGCVELEIPEGVHIPKLSSVDLANCLDIAPGESVLDLGCGSGILSVAAAKRGARLVVATDLNPSALEATRRNALANHVAGKVMTLACSWYEGLEGRLLQTYGIRHFDIIIATPPQTPGPKFFGPRYGGPRGIDNLLLAAKGASKFLEPDRGRLWLLAISLADTGSLIAQLRQQFRDVSVVCESERPFAREEYDALHPGLFDYFLMLRDAGAADFSEAGEGSYSFRNIIIRACGLNLP